MPSRNLSATTTTREFGVNVLFQQAEGRSNGRLSMGGPPGWLRVDQIELASRRAVEASHEALLFAQSKQGVCQPGSHRCKLGVTTGEAEPRRRNISS
jgi:hypothetical protein